MRALILILLFTLGLHAQLSKIESSEFTSDELAWINEHKEVTFTGDPNWLPFEAFDEKGKYIGIVADHLKLIEQRSNLRFVPRVVSSWDETLKIADNEEVQVVSGDIADVILQKKYKALDPYLINPIVIVMNKDENYVDDLMNLRNRDVGIIKGYGYTSELFRHYPKMRFKSVENIQEGMRKVERGQLDALLVSNSLAKYSLRTMGISDLKIVGKTKVTMEVTLFVAKSEPRLYEIMRKSMHSIDDVESEAIVIRWLASHDETKHPMVLYYNSIGFVFAVFIVLFYVLYARTKKRKEQYRFAITGSNDALWHWNIEKNGVYISSRLQEILGYESVDTNQTFDQWIKCIHVEDRHSIKSIMDIRTHRKKETFRLEYRMHHKNGNWRWIRMRAKTFYSKKGVAIRMDGFCSDITREKNLSMELFRSQQLLTTIIDTIPVHVFWKDKNSVYLGCNRLFSQGISDDPDWTIVGKTDFDLPWSEQAQGYIQDDQEVMRHNIVKLNYEEMQTNAYGETIWLSTSKIPLVDEKGEVFAVLGAYYDISEHKKHLLDNENKAKRLESAEELGHLGSWEWNIKTGALAWSDEVYRIFGEIPQSFPARFETFKTYIPPEYHEGLEKAIDDAIHLKTPYEYDHEVRRKDGSLRLVREAGYVIFDDKDTPLFMYGTILDINSIADAKIVKMQNKELTELLKKFDDNVIASNTDLNGIITYASKAFSKISGYSIEELVGSAQNIVRHPDVPRSVFEELWKAIKEGKIWQGEIKNKKKSGEAYWVSNTISPIFDEDQNIIGYSAIRHDITHEREVEDLHESLERKSSELASLNASLEERISKAVLERKHKDHLMAQQSKLASMGEMIGNIAHQWRQPLNALGLLLQKQEVFFDKGVLSAEKMHESVAKGLTLIDKMSTTIDDFRDFFKPNKEKTRFELLEVIEDSLALIDAALYNKNIDLELDIPDGISIYGFKNEFSQVLLNLINNAKDALVETDTALGVIMLSAFTKEHTTIIQVSDNAGGIPAGVIEHVFEPYYTTKDEGKGTGIGLYMSKMIIEENMGGLFSVANGEKGAVFTIELKDEVEAS